jgi:hypothetical protein
VFAPGEGEDIEIYDNFLEEKNESIELDVFSYYKNTLATFKFWRIGKK